MVEDDGNLAVSSFDSLDASNRDITLNRLCSGLLDLLAECLIFISESKLDKVLGIVLKPETLIVLAHHHSEEIRTSVVKVREDPLSHPAVYFGLPVLEFYCKIIK